MVVCKFTDRFEFIWSFNAVLLNLFDVAAHFSPRLWFWAHFTKILFQKSWLGVIMATKQSIIYPRNEVAAKQKSVNYILQPIVDVLNEAELFRRFIDDIIWISASEISNERIRQALTSAFENSDWELTFRQACTAEKTAEVEFLDVNHCVTIEDDFGFVTKDFVKPTAEGRHFINGNSHHRKRHSSQSCLEKLLDWCASTKEKMITSAA